MGDDASAADRARVEAVVVKMVANTPVAEHGKRVDQLEDHNFNRQ